ncbi:MAG: hypothetical protein UR28_C0020G0027 [Candidatus Peregrinibacteria bacterium GW2011_GWF2_33_10]|nr:MAG: hypothetical protein UR28_C0020G0027 [Candidatus Peregrinibacteria bacterium GW2011_GWF2_33_10]OGJ45330.1 MAG: hypothetical protein A2272_06265 [Candidatus Peregrinibacteria bacterium RIFOXYA12_FULL_33_12]OGJ45378.1 MAG: hypothetical protein A2263_03875 [Candidatus Peregrinibacteria bacterium RIFOXYA2_FULL_33_21]
MITSNKIHKSYIVLIILLLIILVANLYSFQQYRNLKNTFTAFSTVNQKLDGALADSQALLAKFQSDDALEKAQYNDALTKILPNEEAITDLNRDVENFVNSINSTSNPIFLEKISYGKMEEDKIAQSGIYQLPFSMNFASTEDNFQKMIAYFESSGNLENQTRLMELTKISANWQGEQDQSSNIELYNFVLEGKAYFYNGI